VVTGGGAGIGRSLCLAFAAEGMNVVVADREADRAQAVADEVAVTGARALAQTCDVTDAAAVDRLRDAALDSFGAVNILCNNAGVVQSGPLAEASLEDWDWVFKVNLFGVINGIRSFVPQMKRQGGGHIVNSASLAGMFVLPGFGIYSASKFAVVAISETLRIELASDGIGVSVLCPGPVRSRIDETTRTRGLVVRNLVDGPPLLALCEPEDAAQQVLTAIEANRPYIFTRADGVVGTKMRFEAILADFARR
jgi:NAD(P)-dependent dehydrogenase (short-subunit alcohol dehydrogenase family)